MNIQISTKFATHLHRLLGNGYADFELEDKELLEELDQWITLFCNHDYAPTPIFYLTKDCIIVYSRSSKNMLKEREGVKRFETWTPVKTAIKNL